MEHSFAPQREMNLLNRVHLLDYFCEVLQTSERILSPTTVSLSILPIYSPDARLVAAFKAMTSGNLLSFCSIIEMSSGVWTNLTLSSASGTNLRTSINGISLPQSETIISNY